MGRARRFDESNLLDAATELFWSNGYDSTSVEDVSAATGVGNGSIYAAYGSKQGLFLAAFERYCEARAQFVRATTESAPGTARSAIRALLRAIIEDCATQPHRRGCLMINSVAHLASRIPEVATIASRTTTAMESGVATRLHPAAHTVTTAEVSALSANIILVSQGLIQLSRLHTSPTRLTEIAEITCAGLPSWADK
ncbi:TetR family transcriptional regulator [Nocardia sp. SYP-A9097]|uniref:TetR/AcrR family transcriptional regulator n=1 Tax=Nocardia sp. SYP-A9097 TaxID=2663237 RepID=UPI00129ABC29|nr:TetR/AcrR family transcriptional regulator [Nocardia sp. SYP-A9097]MRH87715.1 TetR family transcriptional regulator [Nocardia sp. SYP-A9097]